MTWEVHISPQENILHQDGSAAPEEAVRDAVEPPPLKVFKTQPDEAMMSLI